MRLEQSGELMLEGESIASIHSETVVLQLGLYYPPYFTSRTDLLQRDLKVCCE